jgi:hypothetical protein
LKLFLVALGLENRQCKRIFIGGFLKSTTGRNHVLTLAVLLRMSPVQIGFSVAKINFVLVVVHGAIPFEFNNSGLAHTTPQTT